MIRVIIVKTINNDMPVVCKRQHVLFNKFPKPTSPRNVNADNTVGQPSRANADPNNDPSGIG
ncbi:hypothetical protein BCR32DRAFT_294537 [Anaeromyces robustus]|uniref:Uncharacterized protein n=1 Tax=Anaeromyces robustus TaxID=1754192 RepID=A0A1Y1X098_9FUNG|nr:hypothetical protein BCR32DRAFT_294537 [Anaeromyces robustus]|eukprot:ORX79259.1 hypothetical protein BCR32DRAFT_294537 [Anaeromyces robustus]